MSEWNTSDIPSRIWEKKKKPAAKSFPKRPSVQTRRNRKYVKKFDSTKGYPGEGPRVKQDKKQKRSPVRKVLQGKFLEYRTQKERQEARTGVDLRWATLAPKTIALYREAFTALWMWVGKEPPKVVRDQVAYDMMTADFIMHAWTAGYTRALAGNAVSASIKVYPEIRGHLPESWYLLNAWMKLEVSCRAAPMPPELCVGLIHICLEDSNFELAFLLALGFECFLRPGEMLGLRWRDIELPKEGSTGIIRLHDTKTSRRTGAPEVLTFRDTLSVGLFQALQLQHGRSESASLPIFKGTEAQFRASFKRLVALQGAATWGLRPHSVRRGGATAYFRATGSMARTIERGRWATTRVARLYICDGLATGLSHKIDAAMRQRLQAEARQVSSFLRSIQSLHSRWRTS
jgi:integrase